MIGLTGKIYSDMVSRIAPTPSGYLHLGNAFSFLLTWLLVRKRRGILQLRIDDIDTTRLRREYVDDIFSTLEWLQIDYDKGASGTDDFFKNYSQQKKIEQYYQYLNLLKQNGILFACDCSRGQIKQRQGKNLYAGTCRSKNLSFDAEQVAWRIKTDNNLISFQDYNRRTVTINLQMEMPYFVVRRKDKIPAYQLVSVVDDLEAGITSIIRGKDLLASTAAQCYLASCLQKNDFSKITFFHHDLLYKPDGSKLSKSQQDVSLKDLRAAGYSIEKLYHAFCEWLHLPEKTTNLRDLLTVFDEKYLL